MSDDRSAAPGPVDPQEPDGDPTGSAPAAGSGGTARAPKKKRPFWIEFPILIVIAFVLTFLIQTFLVKVYYVPSGSMETTLHGAASGGDRILANKVVYDFRDPQPGDVAVFKGPENWVPEVRINSPSNWFSSLAASVGSVVGIAPPDEKDFVKRVIATGGQTVECCDATGNVMVDGRSLDEPYIYEPIPFVPGVQDCQSVPLSSRCFGPVTIPEGQIWMMGDHRSDSADSSYQCQGQPPGNGAQCQGPVPVDNVIGKAIFIVMPPSRWGTIGNPDIDPSAQALALSSGAGVSTAAAPALGLLGTMVLRGGVAMTPGRRRRRRTRRAERRTAR
ncbi:signal peptidase I [Nakamurella flavida]|uniref:Signal peptidase I n=1 Tax=Nakamurella flavida TaxID=363630 RepID=A0A938YEE2_9ACTN|nr:signal peptidase I [Nakamurella flavida]MBM9476136.1 signal peptidase I [Nakamurella flavida]MDP9777119.1 signal peptidase I [Nakamurella flavida]